MSTTHINYFGLRRSCTQGILGTSLVLLLSASLSPSAFVLAADGDNKIDHGLTSPPPPPPGVSTSEVLEVGPPPTKHEKSTVTRTVTLTMAYKPTLAPGDSTYSLLGCYGHTGFEGVHPFGKEKDYASPPSLDAKNVSVAACLDGCAKLPSPDKKAGQFAYVGLKNGSPRLSCGGKDAIAIYNLASGSQKSSSTDRDKFSSSSTTTRPPPKSESLTTAPIKTPQVGIGAHSPSSAPAASHPVFDGHKNGGGNGPPAPASTTTVAAISGSMSGVILLGAIFFFCFRAYKKRRIEQDARVAAMVIARKTGQKADDDDDKGHYYERSPSRGRRRTREYHRPPSLIVGGDTFGEDRDVRLTTDGALVPTTPALESGGKDPAGFYHHTNNNIMMGGEQQQQQQHPQRDSLFSALLGQVSVPIGPRTPPAIGSSSAVQWRRTADMAAAAAHSVPVNPLTKPPDNVAVLSGSLGERAWHRRRISTPYAPPPTAPLPPTPPNKKQRLAAAIGGLGRGGADRSDRQPPQRPPRRESAATFEAAPRTPGATSSIPESYRDKTLEYDGDDEEGGVKPVPPLKTRMSQQLPNNNHGMMGDMVYVDYHEGRQPTIPSLPPITPREEFELDSPYWRSLVGMRRNTDGDDDRSPRSATTVGTSILMESPTLPWETDPTRRT
ncbi:uncharacterized protein PG986_011006 [Apiospora aurea]|uniref:Uncharacterized protein n=1 Tax=Apiospora aurea TaxID=335848 RepID=A0ABR1Q3X9_9PEZI